MSRLCCLRSPLLWGVMPYYNIKFRYFVARAWAATALIIANVAIYGASTWGAKGLTPSASTLLRLGAITNDTVSDHQYWRLFAAGFLHFNPFHLATNMLCLFWWGSALEKRIGTLYFTLIYFLSLLSASLVSVLTHRTPFMAAGASGAISGILGALCCLCILGKIELSTRYIQRQIVLLAAFSAVPGIDWRAHFGGFCAGLVICAALELVLSASRLVFRCKIPEFIKMNTAILAGLLGIRYQLFNLHLDYHVVLTRIGVLFGLYIVALKLTDVLLSLTKGLMLSVLWLAALNALAVFVWQDQLLRMLMLLPREIHGGRTGAFAMLRAGLSQLLLQPCALIAGAAVVVFCATLIAYRFHLRRGWNDAGFVNVSLEAEKNRRRGL